ncbi:MAG TPA: hydroxymethylbilane synthase [Candidatus Sulfomarinibacteraceae bacterium]|nr:hydroxymethylbilane synthase [Candidatus Sulfomarinibacteraceae bacterium]
MALARSAVPSPATPATRLRLGTRGSALAIAQSSTVADALRAHGVEVELVTVRTVGDDRPPDTAWGEGAFVGALEAALLEGTVDLAVHSAKDVPTTEHPRLTIGAYPLRADPRDALVGREPGMTLDRLPRGARVGTDSPRRTAFLRAIRPDLTVHPLHGNVDTRLRRLDEGSTDALVLAVAGLTRLGRADRIGQVLDVEMVPPAPGQGALAIQCRAGDNATRAWLARLDDPATRSAVETEREFLRATGGGCRAPIGALGRIEGDEVVLHGATAGIEDPHIADGERPPVVRGDVRGPVADRLVLAARLAGRLTGELAIPGPGGVPADTAGSAPTRGRAGRVLVTRAPAQAAALVESLAAHGLASIAIPTIEIRPVEPGGELDAAVLRAAGRDGGWIVVTSANGANAVLDAADRLGVQIAAPGGPRGWRWAAVGTATRAALEARGVHVSFTPSTADAVSLAAELPVEPGGTVLLPRADIADGRLVATIEARGARVDAVVAYRTHEAPAASRDQLRAAFAADGVAAIVFTSGSTVRGLLGLLGAVHRDQARRLPACCIGETTAAAAREAGFGQVVVAPAAEAAAIAGAVREALTRSPIGSALERLQEDPA